MIAGRVLERGRLTGAGAGARRTIWAPWVSRVDERPSQSVTGASSAPPTRIAETRPAESAPANRRSRALLLLLGLSWSGVKASPGGSLFSGPIGKF